MLWHQWCSQICAHTRVTATAQQSRKWTQAAVKSPWSRPPVGGSIRPDINASLWLRFMSLESKSRRLKKKFRQLKIVTTSCTSARQSWIFSLEWGDSSLYATHNLWPGANVSCAQACLQVTDSYTTRSHYKWCSSVWVKPLSPSACYCFI